MSRSSVLIPQGSRDFPCPVGTEKKLICSVWWLLAGLYGVGGGGGGGMCVYVTLPDLLSDWVADIPAKGNFFPHKLSLAI